MVINNGKKPTEGRFISCVTQKDGSIDITVPPAAAEEFRVMVRRAVNTWPDKSYELMDFADRILGLYDLVGINKVESLAENSNGTVEVIPKDQE